MLTNISKCHDIFKFWQFTKNSYSLNSLMTNILTIRFRWNGMKTVGAVGFWNLNIGNFAAKCTEWPQTKLKESGMKSTLPMCTVVPRVPNFDFQHKRKSKGCWWWWFDVLVVWIFQHKRMSTGCWWRWFGVLVVWIFQQEAQGPWRSAWTDPAHKNVLKSFKQNMLSQVLDVNFSYSDRHFDLPW